jgi:hypothetical protein
MSDVIEVIQDVTIVQVASDGPQGATGATGPTGPTGSSGQSFNTQHTSGRYVRTQASITPSTVTSFSANVTRYVPLLVPTSTTYDRIGIYTGSILTGTPSVRLGIFNNNAGKPGTLVLDAGTVAPTTTTTAYEITINQTLPAGFYWLAFNAITAAATGGFYGIVSSAGAITTMNSYISLNWLSAQTAVGFNESVNVTSGYSNAGTVSEATSVPLIGLRVG